MHVVASCDAVAASILPSVPGWALGKGVTMPVDLGAVPVAGEVRTYRLSEDPTWAYKRGEKAIGTHRGCGGKIKYDLGDVWVPVGEALYCVDCGTGGGLLIDWASDDARRFMRHLQRMPADVSEDMREHRRNVGKGRSQPLRRSG